MSRPRSRRRTREVPRSNMDEGKIRKGKKGWWRSRFEFLDKSRTLPTLSSHETMAEWRGKTSRISLNQRWQRDLKWGVRGTGVYMGQKRVVQPSGQGWNRFCLGSLVEPAILSPRFSIVSLLLERREEVGRLSGADTKALYYVSTLLF